MAQNAIDESYGKIAQDALKRESQDDQLSKDMEKLETRTGEVKKIKGLLPQTPIDIGSLVEPGIGDHKTPLLPSTSGGSVGSEGELSEVHSLARDIKEDLSGDRFSITPEMNAVTAPGPKASLDESVVDFLFGGEMSIVGLQYDNGALTHDWDIAKKQWSEAPVWENVLNVISLGSYALPLAQAAAMPSP
jgi:hypothetical protein